jgi:hypothetical protein
VELLNTSSMSSSEERERKLNRLGRSFRHDLDVEVRREKANLRKSLTQDFERDGVGWSMC